ncbi:MAG: hypothetical protein GY707_00865 [Desulfobacteraceae bacterium]|nr:hypothetical protein [Desulfobacteraceae bacterium]
MKKRVLLIILGLFLFFVFGSAVHAAQNITASLTAHPSKFSGKCPALITFKGKITVREPGRVQYKFIRSDGANAPVQTLNFQKAGSMAVSTTWQIGRNYTGWEAIQIVYPMQVQSNRANFRINCTDGQNNQAVRKPDLGMYGFLKIGKNSKQVKWNETIVLTPADATLISNGKPAFEVYYAYREYNGKAVAGPFKNKIFFKNNLVSKQTNLSCGSKEIKNVHTQAYLGPQNGKLQIKIDADNEVAESRENNNFHFFVNIQFKGFGRIVNKKPDLVIDNISLNKACEVVVKLRNIGQGQVPNKVWTVHKPNSSSVYLSINNKGWGGSTIWKFDPGKGLENSGGTAIYVSSLKVTGTATVKAEIDHTKQVNESNETNNIKTKRLTCQAGASTQPPVSVIEDCISFNPTTTTVQRINSDWKIVDGSHWMFSFGNKKTEAEKALAIIKHYRMNRSCFVGRPNPSFTYLKVGSAAPAGSFAGEDCLAFDPNNIIVKQISGDWKIVDGSHWIFSFGSKKAEADQALAIIKKYGFTSTCYVGRPGPSFKYLRK